MSFYDKVMELCRQHGIAITALVVQLGLSKSAATNWKTSRATPRPGTVKKVADFFHVPIAYLLDDAVSVEGVHDNHGIIGNTHAPVFMNCCSSGGMGEIECELLAICSKLDMKRKNALLSKAYELLEEH